MREEKREVKIIYEDGEIVVIDKPAGWIVNKSDTTKEKTIQEWHGVGQGVGEFYDKGGVVHRLDKDTSGVMVLAKTEVAYEGLKKQFLERKTVKKYVALVHGIFKEKEGIISLPVERYGQKFGIGKDLARTAITEWSVLKELENYSLVELMPRTGRTHQLRVHLKHMGHPIVSDPIYGGRKQLKEDLKWCPRLFLHAKYLEFEHPMTGKRVSFETELPEELEKVLDYLDNS